MTEKYYRYFFFLLLLVPNVLIAQTDCRFRLSGSVLTTSSNEGLEFASVYCHELKNGALTQESGRFAIEGFCAGSYRFTVSLIGYKTLDTTVVIKGDRDIAFVLTEENELKEVQIETRLVKRQEMETLQKSVLSGLDLEKTRGLSLGEALKSISGVTTIQTGPSISKPMIHGLYGNRILLMNNGVRLEGQTWGAEHAPEIDPFIATKLTVVKGAACIRYGMDAMAGVVLVDPKDMPKCRTLGGEINLVGASNGKGGTVSGFLEGGLGGKLTGLSWRIQGTLRKSGSFSTPTYYLTNTAVKESNNSAALTYNRKNFGTELFYSDFNTDLGIYSGSHVGNLNDLYAVFNSPQPIVKSEFSYRINRGYQSVHHLTTKAKAFYTFRKLGKLEYTFARQENKRSEFGEDVSFNQSIVNANIPDAYFQLTTYTSDLVLEHKLSPRISGSAGLNYLTQANIYRGLDYRALIPNYRNYSGGAFLLEKWDRKKLTIEAGARYDYKWMRTYTEDFTTLTKRSSDYSWKNLSVTLGSIYKFSPHFSLNSSIGTAWRPPASIELFALGIHQSAASFEIGDTSLKVERSYNVQSYGNFSFRRVQGEVGVYFNSISNYIFLQPLSTPVVTVSGTFPAFKYTQANVYYTGVDATVNADVSKVLSVMAKATVIYAYNRSIHDYLIYVPSNRYTLGLKYAKAAVGKLKEVYAGINAQRITTQNHVPKNVDYLPPPKGYTLLNAEFGFGIPVSNQQVNVSFSANNLLNTTYRDYLNRFRYYANDLGRNFTVRVKIPFAIF